MISRPPDTTPGSWSEYYAVLDRMDGSARVQAAVELSEGIRTLRLAGIRDRHPGLTDREVVARLVSEDYGITLPTSP